MDPSAWIALAVAGVGAIVWLVRLEGRVNSKADADRVVTLEAEVAALKVSAKTADDTKMEVVRLQEQIKHLTDLIEKYFVPAPVRARKAQP
jgi:hypothetical protein